MQTAMQWIRHGDRPFLTFVVKGPEQSAREQMFVRGIVAQTIGFTRTDTVFKTGLQYRDQIAEWFGESPAMLPGYGFPDGTCLIYSTHEITRKAQWRVICPACSKWFGADTARISYEMFEAQRQ